MWYCEELLEILLCTLLGPGNQAWVWCLALRYASKSSSCGCETGIFKTLYISCVAWLPACCHAVLLMVAQGSKGVRVVGDSMQTSFAEVQLSILVRASPHGRIFRGLWQDSQVAVKVCSMLCLVHLQPDEWKEGGKGCLAFRLADCCLMLTKHLFWVMTAWMVINANRHDLCKGRALSRSDRSNSCGRLSCLRHEAKQCTRNE